MKPWPHKKKARRLAARKRQHKRRAKYKSIADLVLPLWAERPLARLLGVGDIPDDIKEKVFKVLIRYREELRKRSDRPPGILIEDVHCKYSFPLEFGVNACNCTCKKARYVTKARAFVTTEHA
jgi:hypothetical protein